MYPFLPTTTLYWIATETFTADPAWPSNILLHHHLTFSTNHNLGLMKLMLKNYNYFISCDIDDID